MDKRTENEKKKEYLRSYRVHVRRIARIEEELAELRLMRESISVNNDGMPHGTGKGDLSGYAAELDRLEQELLEERYRRILTYKDIAGRIKKLRSTNENDVMFYRYIKGMSETATSVFGNILAILDNLISFISNVFTGNWQGAWENVKSIFGNVFEGLVSLFKAPINAIIGGWNSLAASLGSISIPDWVPAVGGKSWSLPTLAKLKVGMDYVPSDDFPALLHRGEAVLTAEDNKRLRSLGGLDGIEKLLSMGSTDSGTSVVMAQVDRELIEAILKLAKLADRPVAAYFNVDGHTLSETIAEPMDASIKDMNKLKDMLKGVRW